MCPPHNSGCFSEEEKKTLSEKGWTEEQVKFAEDSVIEDKIKEMIN